LDEQSGGETIRVKKRILGSLLAATLPFGSALAAAPKEKDAKVTLVYEHELPNVPGKSIKGVLVEYGPGRLFAWPHASQIRLHLRDRARGGDPQSGQRWTGDDLQGRRELLRAAGDRHGVSANASETEPAKLLAVFVVDTNETELTTPFGN
jgi:quercetin dioxygenase-like cupin family protein